MFCGAHKAYSAIDAVIPIFFEAGPELLICIHQSSNRRKIEEVGKGELQSTGKPVWILSAILHFRRVKNPGWLIRQY